MGTVPRWYRLVKAAQFLGVPIWELETRPWRYVLQAEAAASAEHQAARSRSNRGTH